MTPGQQTFKVKIKTFKCRIKICYSDMIHLVTVAQNVQGSHNTSRFNLQHALPERQT